MRTSSSKENDAKMYSCDQLQQYFGSDVWKNVIYKQMKQQTYLTIRQVLPLLKTTGQGFELFGFDYMMDDDLNVYLIEVNLDPDQSHSTNVTHDIVPKCINGIIDIVTRTTDDDDESTEFWDKLHEEQ